MIDERRLSAACARIDLLNAHDFLFPRALFALRRLASFLLFFLFPPFVRLRARNLREFARPR